MKYLASKCEKIFLFT